MLHLVIQEIHVQSNELIFIAGRGGVSQEDGEEKGNNLREGSDK